MSRIKTKKRTINKHFKKNIIMSVFNMSEEEKKKILEKHKEATKNHYIKKDDLKQGLKKPKDDKKTT